MTKKMLYLVRHGQTDWNTQERMQGAIDIPLNETGKKQAQALADHLKSVTVTKIFSSPLVRAHETARIIGSQHKNLEIITHRGLEERSFGVLEGKTRQELYEINPAAGWEDSWNYPHWKPEGGETLRDVHNRLEKFYHEVVLADPAQSIALVSHGVAIRILIGVIMHIPMRRLGALETTNASMTVIEVSDRHGAFIHVNNYLPRVHQRS